MFLPPTYFSIELCIYLNVTIQFRIVSDRHMARLKSLLDQTQGNKVIGGSCTPDDKFMSPTVVTDVKLDDALMKVGRKLNKDLSS